MSTEELTGGGEGQTPVHPDDLLGLRHRWISNQGQLDELERQNVLEGRRWAVSRITALDRALDDVYLRKMHEQMFGRVWNWAGTYRRRDTSIGVDWVTIPAATHNVLHDARQWFSVATDTSDVRTDLARLHHELTVIHPFPNGNGRLARLFVDVTCRSLGVDEPAWGRPLVAPRDEYLAALRAADRGGLSPLVEFMWSQ